MAFSVVCACAEQVYWPIASRRVVSSTLLYVGYEWGFPLDIFRFLHVELLVFSWTAMSIRCIAYNTEQLIDHRPITATATSLLTTFYAPFLMICCIWHCHPDSRLRRLRFLVTVVIDCAVQCIGQFVSLTSILQLQIICTTAIIGLLSPHTLLALSRWGNYGEPTPNSENVGFGLPTPTFDRRWPCL